MSLGDGAASVGAVALLLAAGMGLSRWLRPQAGFGPEVFGLAFATGAAWLASGLCLWEAILPPARLAVILLPAAAAGLLVLPSRSRPAGPGAAEWLGFLPAAAVALFSLWLAAQRPVWNVDAQMRWMLHGQWLHEYGTALPERVQDPSWAPAHPAYPPLVPAVIALALGLGSDRDFGVRLLFPWFLLAMLGIVYGYARRRAPRAAPWLTLAFALTPCLAYLPRYLREPGAPATTGLGSDDPMADVPLSLMLTATSVVFLDLLAEPRRRTALLCALLGAGAALTKQEGMAFAPLMLLTGLVACAITKQRERVAGAAIAFAGAAGAAVLWKLLSARMPVMPGEDYVGAGISAVFSHLDRLPAVLGRLATEMTSFALWGPLWLVPPLWLAVALVRRRLLSLPQLLPALWLLLALGLIVAAFLATGWRDGSYAWLMDVSLTRLLIHHAPLCALLAAQLPELARAQRGLPRPVD
ncbi:MAG: hypothetical protein EYC70_16225 [Planctomycetota bacterium]|nr:MAG: hypothetical protein EYC70_16225 [Planctomycetota bacterium]